MIGVKNREERSQHFFDTSVPLMDDGEDIALYDRVREGAAQSAAQSHSALPPPRHTPTICRQPDWRGLTCASPSRPCSGRKDRPGGRAPSSFPEGTGRPRDLPSRTFGNADSGKTRGCPCRCCQPAPCGGASQVLSVPRFGQQCFRSRLFGGLGSFLLRKNKCLLLLMCTEKCVRNSLSLKCV